MSSAGASTKAAVAQGDELALFHRTLAELCRADLPLPRAFQLLQGDLRRGRFRDAVDELAADVEAGVPLGEAYTRRKGRFPPLYCALVEAGMVSGDLPGVLEEISRHAGQRAAFAARLRAALAYPVVAALFVLGLGAALLVTAGPTLWSFSRDLGADSPLAWAAGVLAGLLALVVAAVGFGWARPALDRSGKRVFRLPVLGRIRLYAAKASLATTLALLLGRRVPLPTALSLAAESCEDGPLAERLREAAERAGEGASLSAALRDAGALEPTLLWLVEAAEGSREVPRALDDAAEIYARRLERAVDRLATVVRPVAEFVLGVVVFVLAYTVLIPLIESALGIFRL